MAQAFATALRAIRRGTPSTAWKRAEAGAAVVGFEVEQVKGWRWWLLVAWFALLASLHCLPAWFAALCLLSVVSALAGFIPFLVKGTLFGSFVVPAGGTALPLGLGDLNNLFLLVGLGLFILSRNTVSNPLAGYQP